MANGVRRYRDLEKKLGYRFRDKALLELALTHPSFRYETENGGGDNQRLEFLGDAVLNCLAGSHLFCAFEDMNEGALTRLRSRLTSGRTLAQVARGLELGEWLEMGKGEVGSGGRKRSSNLADALEAVIGAAYLDGKLRAAQKVFCTVLVPLLDKLMDNDWEHNPKGELQQYAQGKWKAGPEYQLIGKEGPQHAAVFSVRVVLPDGMQAHGEGTSRQQAEMQAAKAALQVLVEEGGVPRQSRLSRKKVG